MKKDIFFISLLYLFLCSCLSSEVTSVNVSNKQHNGKTSLSLYMVGGNLEDDVKPRNGIPDEKEKNAKSTAGSGSNDLRELISGYQSLSQNERNNFNIFVAFGGARKEGWQGVKYADMDCLIKDSDDRYFGNDSCYSYSDDKSNMAERETFESFLKFIKNKSENSDRKIIDLWDHGFAYLGMGQDSNNGNDLISLNSLKSALKNSDSKFDLIAIDACLMGSIEVANAIKNYADYMVASEELEPAHGWNYNDVVNIIGKKDSITFEDIGKKLVDSYIDNPEHKKEYSKFKTLSFINLRNTDNVIKKLDLFSSGLNMQYFSKLLNALEESQKFGDANKSKLTYTIDLANWVSNIKSSYSASDYNAQEVLNALSQFVIYSRHDSSKPNSNGISIYSLNKNMEDKYGIEQTISNTWLNFSKSFVKFGTNDFSSPEITEGDLSTKSEIKNLCNYENKTGHCLNISDNLGLKTVEQVFALKSDPRYLFMIGSKGLKPVEKNKYFAPVWDGEWFLLCNGDCDTGESLFPPAYLDSFTEDGFAIYSADAVLNGEDVVFYFETDKNNKVVSQWAIPYTIGDNGEVFLNRQQLKISTGDTIQFFYQVYDLIAKQILWKKGDSMTFSMTPEFDFATIDSDKIYYVYAEDFKGNISNSKVYEVKR